MSDRITLTYPLYLSPGCALNVGGKWAVVRHVVSGTVVDVVPYSVTAKIWWTLAGVARSWLHWLRSYPRNRLPVLTAELEAEATERIRSMPRPDDRITLAEMVIGNWRCTRRQKRGLMAAALLGGKP